jgi:hypothetical protein
MISFRRSVSLCLLLAASIACGGGGTTSKPAPSNPTPPPAPATSPPGPAPPFPEPQPSKAFGSLSEEDQASYITAKLQHAQMMTTGRPTRLDAAAVARIREHLSDYSGGELRAIFERAATVGPVITNAFRQANVPPAAGLALAMQRSEFRECSSSGGRSGLFMMTDDESKAAGGAAADRCKPDRAAAMAAQRLKSLLAAAAADDPAAFDLAIVAFGLDVASAAELNRELGSEDRDKALWAMVADPGKAPASCRAAVEELAAFYAALIVSEDPTAFGVDTKPLSALANPAMK